MKTGRAGTATRDRKRRGTATLFAALNTLNRSAIAMAQSCHPHEGRPEFLRPADRSTFRR